MESKRQLLKEIEDEYKKVKLNVKYNQTQKNIKYASLMTLLEQFFNIDIPLRTEKHVDEDVKELYLKISNARIFK